MQEVEITQAVRLNLTGYDREAVTLEPGRHMLPDRAADWVRRNPSVGRVLGAVAEAGASAEETSDGTTEDAPADPDVDADAFDADGDVGTEGEGGDEEDAGGEPVEAAPKRSRTTRRKE